MTTNSPLILMRGMNMHAMSGKRPNEAFWRLGSWSLILTSFAPFLGIPLGQSTSVGFTSLVSIFVMWPLFRSVKLLVVVGAVAVGPVIVGTVGHFLGISSASFPAFLAWMLYVLPLWGFVGISIDHSRLLIAPLRVGIIATAIFVPIQKVLLDAGTIPFLWYYHLPGFASVADNAQIITSSVRRPFALFPEPSFMAGSLALAVAALVVLRYIHQDGLGWPDWIAVFGAAWAILLSESGSASVAVSSVALLALWPRIRGAARASALILISTIGLSIFTTIATSRNSTFNWSWDDRFSSIAAAFRYQLSDAGRLFFGFGRGNTSELFESGTISMTGFQYLFLPRDVYSVLARLVLENGVLVGLPILIYLGIAIFRIGHGVAGRVYAAALIILWLLIGGLTISYDSAVWIWALPGIAIASLQKSNREPFLRLSKL